MTPENNAIPLRRRRSIRLQGYDYRKPGAYFITIVTQGRASLFGDVTDGEMVLNASAANPRWIAFVNMARLTSASAMKYR